MSESTSEQTYFLSIDAVRWAIEKLHSSSIHSSFLLYLHLRRRAIELGQSDNISLNLDDIKSQLLVPGGPPKKPMFRPLSHENKKNMSSYWITDHLAGSYAPSSLRQASLWMTDSARKKYMLPPDHVQRAKIGFLKNERISVLALGTFLLRDFGFKMIYADDQTGFIVKAFREVFSFDSVHDDDFSTLFYEHEEVMPGLISTWFEAATEEPARD